MATRSVGHIGDIGPLPPESSRAINRSMANTPLGAQEGDWAMCFSEPGRVRSIDGSMVRVETADGVLDASLRVLEVGGRTVAVGDWVLMSLGLVVDVVDDAEGCALVEQMRALRQEVEP